MHLAAVLKEAVDHVAHELLVPLGVLRRLRDEGNLAHLGGGRAARFERGVYLLDALGADGAARTPRAYLCLGLGAVRGLAALRRLIKDRVGPAEDALHLGVRLVTVNYYPVPL